MFAAKGSLTFITYLVLKQAILSPLSETECFDNYEWFSQKDVN